MADAGSESACCDTAAIHNACHIWNAIIRIWEVILVRDKGGRSTRVVRVLARNVQRIASSNGCRRIYYHIRAATPRVRSGSAPFQMSNTRLLFAAPSPWQPHDHHAQRQSLLPQKKLNTSRATIIPVETLVPH
ncbi:hypothetical protein AcW1_005623 [Taiwanofungus camphoratus]|nr:hypothetical protein AcW2_004389 [Antrodia cinnamomea]KAI0957135.1 hypothetical protein AcW1_005623 [Antrodia cinnamomea]